MTTGPMDETEVLRAELEALRLQHADLGHAIEALKSPAMMHGECSARSHAGGGASRGVCVGGGVCTCS